VLCSNGLGSKGAVFRRCCVPTVMRPNAGITTLGKCSGQPLERGIPPTRSPTEVCRTWRALPAPCPQPGVIWGELWAARGGHLDRRQNPTRRGCAGHVDRLVSGAGST
jgi:hypothetical protein